jgi:hypothetical protein
MPSDSAEEKTDGRLLRFENSLSIYAISFMISGFNVKRAKYQQLPKIIL